MCHNDVVCAHGSGCATVVAIVAVAVLVGSFPLAIRHFWLLLSFSLSSCRSSCRSMCRSIGCFIWKREMFFCRNNNNRGDQHGRYSCKRGRRSQDDHNPRPPPRRRRRCCNGATVAKNGSTTRRRKETEILLRRLLLFQPALSLRWS